MFGISLATIRLYALVAGLIALSGWLTYERFHLIHEGEARIEATDKAARADERAKVKLEQVDLQHRASLAEAKANATQASFDDYMRNSSVGFRVCYAPGDSGRGLSGDAGPNEGNAVPGAGSEVVYAVPAGAANTVLRAAGRLAILYGQYQQQPEIKASTDAR